MSTVPISINENTETDNTNNDGEKLNQRPKIDNDNNDDDEAEAEGDSNDDANSDHDEIPTTNTETNTKRSQSPSTNSSGKQKHRGRKKVLVGPPYVCQFPNCNKSFQRSEHLSRHKLNHNPKKIFSCTFPECDKTFVRHDLLIRHLKRHDMKIQRQQANSKPSEFLNTVVLNNIGDTKTKKYTPSSTTMKETVQQTSTSNSNINSVPIPSNTQLGNITHSHSYPKVGNPNGTQSSNIIPPPANNINAPNLFTWLFSDSGLATNHDVLPPSHNETYFQESHLNPFNQSSYTNNNTPNANNNSYLNYNHSDSNNFLNDLNEFHFNSSNNFFVVQDDFSPSSTSTGYFSTSPDNHQHVSINDPTLSPHNNNNIPRNFHYHHKNLADNTLHTFQQSQGHQVSRSGGYQYSENLLYTLDNDQMKEFEDLIPALKGNVDFTKLKFEKALKTYWNFFHPRFPMLHRPTFNSTNAPVLLLLSMIVLGSKLFMCVDNITCPDDKKISHPKELSDTICEPLRWLLFASPFFQPPAEVWIIQSLLMLEFYEKHCSNRRLHERSHLHHGTTIQLLRRSPTLGGASTKTESNNDETDNWYKWIEIESMKRATFMCFYMDAIDAICMGHQMFIYSHQIQMTMPVDDVVWESNFGQFNRNYKLSTRPKPFLIVLKNMMNGKSSKTNSFGKKILLAGLSAILFQIQQRDLQLFFGLDKFTNSISENWRDLLTAAFAIWRNDVGGSCCSSKTAIDNLNSLGNSSQFSTSDTRCKCIAYHLAHIYMSISHYDIFIVCGAPWRMNVKPSSKLERESIKGRVVEWTKTRHCDVSIVQCYLSLFEMFLSPQDSTYDYQYNYLPDADLFFRSYALGYILLVVWSYLYVRGKLSNIDLNHSDNKNAYSYLKNIRDQFTIKSNGTSFHTWFKNPSGSEFYGNLMKWVNVLNDIEGLGNMVGLLELVGEKFANADYVVVKEVGKLLLFCRDRTIGKTDKNILEDMYITT